MNKTSIKTYKNGNFIWKYNTSESLTPDFFQKENISFNVAHILYKRGINTEEKLYHFRYDTLSNLANPFLMKDMHAAVERIIKAINQQESIVIYGDYDVDGITSTSILYRFLKKEGASVDFYIPNREKEGYGLNQQAIEQLAVQGTQLLITVDKGCSVCAGKAFFQMRDLAQVAADAIQHKGPPSAAFAAVQAVSLQNQDRKFYANCANPVCLA